MAALPALANLLKDFETHAASLRLSMQRVETLVSQRSGSTIFGELGKKREAILRDIEAYSALASGSLAEVVVPANVADMLEQAEALRAPYRWTPSEADLLRGKEIMIREFEKPELLPLQEFAHLAGKPPQQIYNDVAERKLLALSIDPRRQRIPSWQLGTRAQQLTRTVLAEASLDEWTVYWALTTGYDSLGGQSPVAVVDKREPEYLASLVLVHLGFH